MTEQDKQLLLKDLCARLPYGVMIQHPDLFRPSILVTEKLEEYYKGHFGSDGDSIEFVKPYLRPMSSMTEEEKKEYTSYCFEQPFLQKEQTPNIGSVPMCVDWLNEHHFDYRKIEVEKNKWKTMIEAGLALLAPDGMYNN